MTNYFEQQAERQTPPAARAKIIRDEKRQAKWDAILRPSPLQLKQMDAAILMKEYRKWRRSIKDEIAAAHGEGFADLMRRLRNLQWARAEEIVDFVFAARWLREADEDTRFETLRFIDSAFCLSRVRDGRPTFDDGLPGDPLQPFHKVRYLLFSF